MTTPSQSMVAVIGSAILSELDNSGVARAIGGDLSRCEIDAGLLDIRDVARAALTAMLDATPDVLAAATDALERETTRQLSEPLLLDPEKQAAVCLRAAILAALNEGEG